MTDLLTARESPPITFEMTEADMRALIEMSARASFKTDVQLVPKKTRIWSGIGAVACLFVTVLLAGGAGEPRIPTWFAMLTLMVGCAAASKLVDDRPRRKRAAQKWVDAALQNAMTGRMLGQHTLTVTEAGVTYATPLTRSETFWPGVQHFAVYNGYVVVTLIKEGLYVPVAALNGVGGTAAFVAFGNRRLAEEGVGIERTMIEYLTAHDTLCKGCHYNLRGVAKLTCPECARPIAWEDVPAAWTREV